MKNKRYKFEISLSVLNHLGRNLYRNFITILGEAISNSWDANANNVWINIDIEKNLLIIKDDGDGMTSSDFESKFLKVGYSKRKKNGMFSENKKRPYIGAKGIGKLALLSCAEKVSVISKTRKSDYIGGIIDNSELTDAIKHDLKPDKYKLGKIDFEIFKNDSSTIKNGTIIRFDQIKEDIRNTIPYLKKLTALYFRFSLVDSSFNIYINDELVCLNDLKDLSEKTQFLWNINKLDDPYLEILSELKSKPIDINNKLKIQGFIATVEKPKYLKVSGTEEKVGIDLFVNGRLREKDILRNLPDFSTRHIASYLYGQIHYNELDSDSTDRFGTSRESVIPGDLKYRELVEVLKNDILNDISLKWDKLRQEIGEDGDIDIETKQRKALSLFNYSSKEYKTEENDNISSWIKELRPDAEFNIPAYVDCFLSENLIRKYIKEKGISITPKQGVIDQCKNKENNDKRKGNLTIDLRESNDDIYFLDMEDLTNIAQPPSDGLPDTLYTDEKQFTPIRNAVMHTSRLTTEAQNKLITIYDSVKSKIKKFLFGN